MNGKRFTDEAFLGIFGTLDQVERRKPGRYFYFFDNKWKKMMSKMPPEHFSQPIGIADATDYDKLFQSWVDRGAEGAETEDGGTVCAWGANSLDELLGYMGFDNAMKKSVTESIDQYNAYCAQGEDEDFGRDPKLLLDVSEPPFFGMYSVEEKPMLGTVALNGLVIDDDQRVLDKNYNPILGLYASGNNSGGRFAVQYSTAISGLTLGMAMTLGLVLKLRMQCGNRSSQPAGSADDHARINRIQRTKIVSRRRSRTHGAEDESGAGGARSRIPAFGHTVQGEGVAKSCLRCAAHARREASQHVRACMLHRLELPVLERPSAHDRSLGCCRRERRVRGSRHSDGRRIRLDRGNRPSLA